MRAQSFSNAQWCLQARLLREAKLTYQSRKRALCDELRLRLPKGCTFTEAPGGYFVWVKLPERCVFFCLRSALWILRCVRVLPFHVCSQAHP